MDKILFLDTTLRDGEQTPGAVLNRLHKVEIARQLDRLGVDIIEAGFPASSNGNFQAVKEITQIVRRPVIAALARAVEDDILSAWEALKEAERPRIHVFIASSDIHIKYKYHSTRREILKRAVDAVSFAKSLCGDVEFSPEDASRSDLEFLYELLEAVIKAGATVINIPDTVGYSVPDEYGALIKNIIKNIPDNVIVSAHCHDDLGNAVSNSLAAIQNGARQIECTVNGIGERAGNASLEEIVMNLNARRDYFDFETSIDTTEISRTSRMVSSLMGIGVPPNKAVVGANVFTHESGIHQHGVLNDRRTYEIITPESIGLTTGKLPLSKLSGRHAFNEKLKELGYNLNNEAVDICFKSFKDYADRKSITDEDIRAIVNEYMDTLESVYELVSFQIQSGNNMKAMAMVTLSCRGAQLSEAALGDGPIDAAFNAINRLSGVNNEDIKLEEYNIKAITEGTDALGEARVKINIGGADYIGRSVSTDIIEASIRSYINALNKWAL
ncbi:MAG: 2-isopropylmalate synthase [Oscillospiraceae bacterium]|nr:2-isopropylmalate synthase [Oscillospiraceae bacterium]